MSWLFGYVGENMEKKPLKVVMLYSDGHIGSTVVFNLFHTTPEIEVVGVLRAKAIPVNKKGKSQLPKYIKKLGVHFTWLLAWQIIVQRIVFFLSLVLPHWKDSALIPCYALARRKGIPILKCESVNSPEAEHFIRGLDPDLVISAYFSQIIDPHILKLPKIGSINIHPGWLPTYRGALSYFWALKNGEDKAGVTIHWMDEGLDTGGIIERKKFRIEPGTTQQQLCVETALIAGRLIQRTARKLLQGKAIIPIDVSAEKHGYYSMPTEEDFKAYFKVRNYFRIRDLVRITRHGVKKRRHRKHRKQPAPV